MVSAAAGSGGAAPAPREVGLSIGGMTCAACAARVQKKLNALDEVSATVNFATGRAIVTAPESVPVQRLIDAVTAAGYRPACPARRRTARLTRRKFAYPGRRRPGYGTCGGGWSSRWCSSSR